jgi:hypothetical protein
MQRFLVANRSGLSFQIADRDENGFRALSGLRSRGINLVANAAAQSADHILSFFDQPLPTSYGEDSYRRIFGTAVDAAPPAVSDTRP